MKTIQSEMVATEKAGVIAAKNTEQAFTKTEGVTKSLKAQLRELKAQLANATDPKDVERLAKAAGELTDKISDATDAAKVFASGSKFEQIGSAFGSVLGKLRNLDFGDALNQSKLLLSTTKSLTFKEALGGIKDLGGTLLNIGKSLLANPLFLLGTAITLIISNFDKLKNSGGAVGKVFEFIGDVINGVKHAITDFADAIGLIDSKTDDLIKHTEELIAKRSKLEEDGINRIIKLRKAEGQETLGIEVAKYNGIITRAKAEIEYLYATSKIKGKLSDEDKKRIDELNEIIITALDERLIVQAEANKKEQDAKKKIQDKEKEDYKKHLEELKKLRLDALTTLLDLVDKGEAEALQRKATTDLEKIELQKQTDLQIAQDAYNNAIARGVNEEVAQSALSERKKQIEAKYWDDIGLLIDKGSADQLKKAEETAKAEKEINDINEAKKLEAKKAAEGDLTDAVKQGEADRKQIAQATVQTLTTLYNDFAQIQQNQFAQQIQNVNDKRDTEIDALDTELKHKTISQKEYDKKKKQIEDKAREDERKLKKEAFEAQKEASIVSTLINTATAIVAQLANPTPYVGFVLAALAAASGAAQIAVIESQPTPKFEKGGKVKGQRHYAGGTMIEAEKDEWIIKRDEAIKNDSLLSAINKGQTDKFIYTNYVAPALKAQIKKNSDDKQKSFADSLASSMMFNFKDENLLDSLKMSRKNDKEIAKYLVSELRGVSTNMKLN